MNSEYPNIDKKGNIVGKVECIQSSQQSFYLYKMSGGKHNCDYNWLVYLFSLHAWLGVSSVEFP